MGNWGAYTLDPIAENSDDERSITTLSTEKQVRNYSEFAWKCVAKKTGP